MKNELSRRQALVGISLAGATGIVPIAAAGLAAPPSKSFAAKVAAWRQAEAEEAAFTEQVYLPAYDAWEAACKAIPHVTLEPDPYSGKRHCVSTANEFDVKDARRDTRGRYWIDPQYPDVVAHYDLMERLKAAADKRDAEKQRLSAFHCIDEHEARCEQLVEATNAAFDAVLAHPIGTAAELAEKLSIIDATGRHDSPPCWETILSDARRLAEREG